MGIRLVDLLGERTISLGAGVTMTVKPTGFAGMKAAEAAALRRARHMADLQAPTGLETPEAREAREDLVTGLAEELLLDELVRSCATGWSGVELADGSAPAPLTPETWATFRTLVPALADRLRVELRLPAAVVVTEGNG